MEAAQQAFAATFFISIVPNVFLFLLPSRLLLQSTRTGHSLDLSALFLMFSCGGLLGDVFIHIIPHLLGSHVHAAHAEESHADHEHHQHDHMYNEKHVLTAHLQENVHAHTENDHNRSIYIGATVLAGFILFFFLEKTINSSLTYNSKKSSENKTNLQVAGWLNIAADCMHNFTDGLAIGATFAAGGGLALATSISVFFHEIPHEIGDFSVLIRSGMSKSGAIKMQFYTAIAAFVGTAVGLFARRHHLIEDYFLAVTAGGFIYIAAVNILPSISHSSDSFFQISAEVACFCVGVLFMVAVAYLE